MKKITLLVFFVATFISSAQTRKVFTQSLPQNLNKEQSKFLGLVNRFYPEFKVPVKIINIYDDDKEVAESYIDCDTSEGSYDDCLIVLQSDNKRLDYEYIYGQYNGNLTLKGAFYLLGSDVYNVEYSGKHGNLFKVLKNGKQVYEENPYEGME